MRPGCALPGRISQSTRRRAASQRPGYWAFRSEDHAVAVDDDDGPALLSNPVYSPIWSSASVVLSSGSPTHCRAAPVERVRMSVAVCKAAIALKPTIVLPAPARRGGSVEEPDQITLGPLSPQLADSASRRVVSESFSSQRHLHANRIR